MYRKLFYFILCCYLTVPVVGAEEVLSSETQGSVEREGASLSSLASGKIILFPEESKRPSDGRFTLKPGDEVRLCIILEANGSPLVERVIQEAVGFRVVFEDDQVPPNALVITRTDKNALTKDEKGCYRESFKVPALANQGVYQVADLLFLTRRDNYVSFRRILFNFSQADELSIQNEKNDELAPELIKIGSFQESTRKIGRHRDFVKIKVTQDFTFREEGAGVRPKSLKVFYLLLENDQSSGIYQAECKLTVRTRWRFYCEVELTRPAWQWGRSHLSLELDSIYLQDKADNLLILQDTKVFKDKAQEVPIRFEFRKKVKKPSRRRR